MDEIVGLSQDSSNKHTVNALNHYSALTLLEIGRYLRFVVILWTRVMTAIVMGGLGIFGSFSLIPFAVNATIFHLAALTFSLALYSPILIKLYYYWPISMVKALASSILVIPTCSTQ
ncbi:uncharacterized protein EI90DRAFT_2523004 [Cantharellus anzutake]|uniref:uncharacterized protein n=1 Tax=Cantharellus anzutake TaxID=1750568 RepID=UPI0019062FEB|nr:uncharacterized protein EI90DRAFT_2523004 [Cantharellus anzutake]KAF8337937.1 hypothetical protein EI90DRAFT_2523004 [Cantharellus anzutake]